MTTYFVQGTAGPITSIIFIYKSGISDLDPGRTWIFDEEPNLVEKMGDSEIGNRNPGLSIRSVVTNIFWSTAHLKI